MYSHLILIYTLSVCVRLCLVAKSCPALWDATNGSLPVSSAHVILQAGILEWDVISFSRDLPNPGIKSAGSVKSPTLQEDSFTTEPPRKPILFIATNKTIKKERESIYAVSELLCHKTGFI